MGLYTNEYKCKQKMPWPFPISFPNLWLMGESFIGHKNHFGRIITNCIKVWQSKHIRWLLAITYRKCKTKWSKAEMCGLLQDPEYQQHIWIQEFTVASLVWLWRHLKLYAGGSGHLMGQRFLFSFVTDLEYSFFFAAKLYYASFVHPWSHTLVYLTWSN